MCPFNIVKLSFFPTLVLSAGVMYSCGSIEPTKYPRAASLPHFRVGQHYHKHASGYIHKHYCLYYLKKLFRKMHQSWIASLPPIDHQSLFLTRLLDRKIQFILHVPQPQIL